MPVNGSIYPEGWAVFSVEIRGGRALHRCECTGECGRHNLPGEVKRCREVNKQAGKFMRGRVVLSVAHTCDCYPLCKLPEHVKAMCQGCHLRFDRWRHAAARLRTQASPNYKAARLKAKCRELHMEDLSTYVRLPKRKRNLFWLPME